jgi:hypothetical protein
MSCQEDIKDLKEDCESVRYSLTNHILPRLNDIEEAVKTHVHVPSEEPQTLFEVHLNNGNVTTVEAEGVSELGSWIVFETISGGAVAKFRNEDVVGWNKVTVSED